MPNDNTEVIGKSETQEGPFEQQERHFHSESDQNLAQVALRVSGVSTLGDIKKLSGYGPEQPDLDDPA